jgi:hypothetical protein
MSVYYGGQYDYNSISKIKGPSGWYNIIIDGKNIPVWIDQSYDGGGWICVLANRAFTAGMNNLSYSDAVNNVNYRTAGGNNTTNTVVPIPSKLKTLADYNIWIGLRYWGLLSGRVSSGKTTIVQFVSGTNGTTLNNTGAHNKRYRWQSNGFSNTYGFTGATAITDETATGVPGMYSYHAANGFSLTTYDLDQDTNAGNCSTFYNNNPWWYGSCWDGNFFAGGGGYADQANWQGAGSQLYQYGAVYIK